jgi:hypothetical protein
MSRPSATHRLARRGLFFAAALSTLMLLAPESQAHFILQAPPSWMSQDSLGAPEKLGPCGDEGGGTPTGTVTAFQIGQTITVTINEVVFHPGHYRIALATTDRSQLPPEPVVTAGSTACGSVPIENPPVFPVLADDVFDHTSPFSSPQSVQLTLPAGVTCDKCTLQVIEFMSDHGLNNPGGCFYHHCADISIGATAPTDGGTQGGLDASVNPTAQSGCDYAPAAPLPPLALLVGALLLALALRRRDPA